MVPPMAKARKGSPAGVGRAGGGRGLLGGVGGVPASGRTAGFVGRTAERLRLSEILRTGPLALLLGPPGVGKTALAAQALEERGLTGVRVVACGDGESTSLLLSRLAIGHERDLLDFERAVAALEERAAAVVVEDAHRLRDPERLGPFFALLAQRGRACRLVVTADRPLVPAEAARLERVSVTLRPLQREDAKALWGTLVAQLGSPTVSFETAFKAAKGNPLRLRQIFVARLGSGGKKSAPRLLDGLGRDEQALLQMMALIGRAAPEELLAQVVPPPRLDRALRTLGSRLLIERAPEGGLSAHEEVLAAAGTGGAKGKQRRRLVVAWLEKARDMDAPLRLFELTRHALAMGDKTRAAARLGREGEALLSLSGASVLGDLLQQLDKLKVKSAPLRALSLRLVQRTRDLEVAYQLLRSAADPGKLEQRFLLGKHAALVGHLSEAEKLLSVAEKQSTHGIPGRRPALIYLGSARAERGNVRGALELVEGKRPVAAVDTEVTAWIRACVADCCERPEDTRRVMAAEISRRGETRDLDALTLGLTMAVAEAEAGAAAHAMMRLGDLERLAALIHDPLGDLQLKLARGIVDVARGATAVGAQLLEQIVDDPRLAFGDRLKAGGSLAVALKYSGRLAEAQERAEATLQAALEHGYVLRALRLRIIAGQIEVGQGKTSQAVKRAAEVRRKLTGALAAAEPRMLIDVTLLEAEARALAGEGRAARAALKAADAALESHLAEADERAIAPPARPHGAPAGSVVNGAVLLARARVLAMLDGSSAARAGAVAAAEALGRAGRARDAAEAELIVAAGALADGDLTEASARLEAARGRELGKWPRLAFEAALADAAIAEARGDAARTRLALIEAQARAAAVGTELALQAIEAALAARDTSTEPGKRKKPVRVSAPAMTLLSRLCLDEPRTLLLVTPDARRPVGKSVQLATGRGTVVIDGVRHAVRGPSGRSVSLAKVDRLRALLYVLASQEGQGVSRDEIIERVWGAPYEPARHDSILGQSINKLRRMLKQATGEAAVLDPLGDGYRLALTGPYQVLIPRGGLMPPPAAT